MTRATARIRKKKSIGCGLPVVNASSALHPSGTGHGASRKARQENGRRGAGVSGFGILPVAIPVGFALEIFGITDGARGSLNAPRGFGQLFDLCEKFVDVVARDKGDPVETE